MSIVSTMIKYMQQTLKYKYMLLLNTFTFGYYFVMGLQVKSGKR